MSVSEVLLKYLGLCIKLITAENELEGNVVKLPRRQLGI